MPKASIEVLMMMEPSGTASGHFASGARADSGVPTPKRAVSRWSRGVPRLVVIKMNVAKSDREAVSERILSSIAVSIP